MHDEQLGARRKGLNDGLGIEKGLMTTIHAYTQDQNLQDAPHKDLRRARALRSTSCQVDCAAKAIRPRSARIKGKLDGTRSACQWPTGSITDLTFVASGERRSTR